MDLLRFIVALLGLITAWTVAFGTKESTSALRAKAQKNGNPFEAFKALFQTTSCCGSPCPTCCTPSQTSSRPV